MVFASQTHVFHENQDFRFSIWLIHFMESTESVDSMKQWIPWIPWNPWNPSTLKLSISDGGKPNYFAPQIILDYCFDLYELMPINRRLEVDRAQ